MIHYSFTHCSDGEETIAIFGPRAARLVADSHANFSAIKDAMLRGSQDVSEVYGLIDAAAGVLDELRRLSDRVTIKGDTVYFDGDAMESRLTRHIVEMIKAGDDNYPGYVALLENVRANPSKTGRKGLFRFLEKHDLTVTDDGCFIAYKAISSDGKSVSGGSEDVVVTRAGSDIGEVHKGRIPNPVGATIAMARGEVDDDKGNACSRGLHVGNHRFAVTFSPGGKFLTVKVNPRDVVEVPEDSNAEKVRVCRYTVLEENESRRQYTGTSFSLPDDEYDEEDDFLAVEDD